MSAYMGFGTCPLALEDKERYVMWVVGSLVEVMILRDLSSGASFS